jgi:hypothetical protein
MNIDNIKKETTKEIREIKLTLEEKEAMLKNVFLAAAPSPYAPIPSRWQFAKRPLVYVLASFLVLLISGSSLSYASMKAIPGDRLYSMKVKIAEPILDAVSFTKVGKAEREAKKAVTRLKEAEQLAEKEKLTPSSRAELEKKFEQNVQSFDEKVKSVENFSEKKAEGLRSSFKSSLDIQAESLQKTGERHKNIISGEEVEAVFLSNKVKEIRGEGLGKHKEGNNRGEHKK